MFRLWGKGGGGRRCWVTSVLGDFGVGWRGRVMDYCHFSSLSGLVCGKGCLAGLIQYLEGELD
jgi:hypothetical protein